MLFPKKFLKFFKNKCQSNHNNTKRHWKMIKSSMCKPHKTQSVLIIPMAAKSKKTFCQQRIQLILSRSNLKLNQRWTSLWISFNQIKNLIKWLQRVVTLQDKICMILDRFRYRVWIRLITKLKKWEHKLNIGNNWDFEYLVF